MDIIGGQLTQTQYNPVFPGAQSTGPLIAGNVMHSDGTGNLANVGETTGTANAGYAVMCQMFGFTQAGSTTALNTNIVIPAQSMIVNMYLQATTVWGSSGTVAVTDTNSNNYVAATTGALGRTVLAPGATKLTVQNWQNVSGTNTTGNGDQQLVVTSSSGTGGAGVLIVEYIQGCNVTQTA